MIFHAERGLNAEEEEGGGEGSSRDSYGSYGCVAVAQQVLILTPGGAYCNKKMCMLFLCLDTHFDTQCTGTL